MKTRCEPARLARLLRAWHGNEPIRGNLTLADCIPIASSKLDGCVATTEAGG